MSKGNALIPLIKKNRKKIFIVCFVFLFLFVSYNFYQYKRVGLAYVESNLYWGDKISVAITSYPWRETANYTVYWKQDGQDLWKSAAQHKHKYSIAGGEYADYRFKAVLDKSVLEDKFRKLLSDQPGDIEIYFGFLNAGNWHIDNVYLQTELFEKDSMCYLKLTQTVVYTYDQDYVSCNTVYETVNLSKNEKANIHLGLT